MTYVRSVQSSYLSSASVAVSAGGRERGLDEVSDSLLLPSPDGDGAQGGGESDVDPGGI